MELFSVIAMDGNSEYIDFENGIAMHEF